MTEILSISRALHEAETDRSEISTSAVAAANVAGGYCCARHVDNRAEMPCTIPP